MQELRNLQRNMLITLSFRFKIVKKSDISPDFELLQQNQWEWKKSVCNNFKVGIYYFYMIYILKILCETCGYYLTIHSYK